MATVTPSVPPMMTVALLPGKPETKMRLVDLQKKERQEQKEQDKKLDAPKNQPQSSTVVNISAKARELNSAAPVDQASLAAKTGSSTDDAAKVSARNTEARNAEARNTEAKHTETRSAEANRTPEAVQPPSAVNTGSADTGNSSTPAKKA